MGWKTAQRGASRLQRVGTRRYLRLPRPRNLPLMQWSHLLWRPREGSGAIGLMLCTRLTAAPYSCMPRWLTQIGMGSGWGFNGRCCVPGQLRVLLLPLVLLVPPLQLVEHASDSTEAEAGGSGVKEGGET